MNQPPFEKPNSNMEDSNHSHHALNTNALNNLSSLVPSLRILIGLGITALIMCGLYFGSNILIPLAFATFLGFLLNPLVQKLKQWGLPSMIAVITIVTICISLMLAGITYLGMQLSGLSQQLPTYQDTIQSKLENLKAQTEGPSVWDGAISTFAVIQQTINGTHTPLELDEDDDSKLTPAPSNPDNSVHEVKIITEPNNPINDVLSLISAISAPLMTAGITFLFVILILLNRIELRDRILLVLGENLNVATDTLDEAADRIGTYLRMQLIVNSTYGVPLALGLFFIGIPAAFLWGTIAVVLRFIPYVGPVISSIFPLLLAFAIDPSWNMVLWTLGLILALELISNNIIEPWLYGTSTGLSTLTIILAATFWTAMWGPIGLILSTPITSCLLVLSRYIPSLKFIEIIIGSENVLNTPQRFYQRLLADNIAEATELANEYIEADLPAKAEPMQLVRKVTGFYDDVAIAAIRLFSAAHNQSATAEHRLRMNVGLEQFQQQMYNDYPINQTAIKSNVRIQCFGIHWHIDQYAAAMVSHALQLNGFHSQYGRDTLLQNPQLIEQSHFDEVDVLCLSIFHPQPSAQIRLISRRIRHQFPHLSIIVAAWNSDTKHLSETLNERFALTAIVPDIEKMILHLELLQPHQTPQSKAAEAIPNNEVQRLEALHQSGVLEIEKIPLYQQWIKQTRLSFGVPYAQISWVDADWVITPPSTSQNHPNHAFDASLARHDSVCTYVIYQNSDLIIDDIHNDPRFTHNLELSANQIRFYAGVPLHDKKGLVLGCLCIMDTEPREMSSADLSVLNDLATSLMQTLRDPQRVKTLLEELKEAEEAEKQHATDVKPS